MLVSNIGITSHSNMAPPIKYQKIKKNCPICSIEFETLLGNKYEKTFCSRSCLGKSRIVPGKKERLRVWAKEYRKNHPEWTRATQKRARQN